MVRAQRRPRTGSKAISCFDGDLVGRLRKLLPPSRDAERLAAVFDALSDVTRLKIAVSLHQGDEACVSDICHVVGTSLSGVSQHLRRLREAAVIVKRRDGKRTYYSLCDPLVGEMLARMLGNGSG
jgi:DNA-binding transcriptional ArsR family regulator